MQITCYTRLYCSCLSLFWLMLLVAIVVLFICMCWYSNLPCILLNSLLCLQIPHLRPTEYKRSRLPRNRRTVNRTYGGVLSGTAVRERLVLACFTLVGSLSNRLSYTILISVVFGMITGSSGPSLLKNRRLWRGLSRFKPKSSRRKRRLPRAPGRPKKGFM